MAGTSGFTADDRQAAVIFRMSYDERAALKQRADEHGLTVQALLERLILNKFGEPRRTGGRTPKPVASDGSRQETLPLSQAS